MAAVVPVQLVVIVEIQVILEMVVMVKHIQLLTEQLQFTMQVAEAAVVVLNPKAQADKVVPVTVAEQVQNVAQLQLLIEAAAVAAVLEEMLQAAVAA